MEEDVPFGDVADQPDSDPSVHTPAAPERKLGLIHRPNVTTLGLLIAAATLLATVVALLAAFDSASPDEARLEVSSVGLSKPREIDGAFMGEITKGGAFESYVDVTLRNDGELPVVVSRLHLDVEQAIPIGVKCWAGSGGGLLASIYDFRIPGSDQNPPPVPLTLHQDVSYEVAPRSADRLSVAIGPSEAALFLYKIFLRLEQDNGESLQVGPLALIAGEGAVAQLKVDLAEARADTGNPSAELSECATETARDIDEVVGDLDEHEWSPSLQSLRQYLDTYGSLDGETLPRTVAETREANWKALGRVITPCGDDVEVGDVHYSDFGGSTAPDALVEYRCPSEGAEPVDTLWAIDGDSPSDAPRWLANVFPGWVRDPRMRAHIRALYFPRDRQVQVIGGGEYPKRSPRHGQSFTFSQTFAMTGSGAVSASNPTVTLSPIGDL